MEYNNSNLKKYLGIVNERIINSDLNPYGKQKAFEAEDAKELKIFNDILKKIYKGEKVTGFDELTLYLEEFAEYFAEICYS